MTSLPSITWILPAHNEAETLAHTLTRLDEGVRARSNKISLARAIIVENGSTDMTWDVAHALAQKSRPGFEVIALQSPDKGIGYAYAAGIRHAASIDPSSQHWILASAADLPFGFTDLDGFLERIASDPSPALRIGSKRHPRSQVDRSLKRQMMTLFFYGLRRVTLGSKVRDSQGTLCLPAAEASKILERTKARDFFFSTEFIYRAEKMGDSEGTGLIVEEVPVVLEPEIRRSTVHPLRDGWRMFKQIVKLRGN